MSPTPHRSSHDVPAPMDNTPTWPAEEGPFVALMDTSNKLEEHLIETYLDRVSASGTGPITRLHLPPSRRRRAGVHVDPSIDKRLREGDDPLCVPLRVAWFTKEQDEGRSVTLKDLVIPGDPRDPNVLRAHLIQLRDADRMRIVLGQPARRSELEKWWTETPDQTVPGSLTFGEFVAAKAWLALERAERNLRGLHYKVPKFVMEELFWSRPFQAGIERLAQTENRPVKRIVQRTRRYLKEIAAQHSPRVIDLVNGITSAMITAAHQNIDYSAKQLHDIYRIGDETPLIFLPSHKSNFDHLVFQHVLYDNGLPLNHTAGGINMNFFLIGPLLRRAGIFFIRREFKNNASYKFVLRQYIDHLLANRFALEWYVEGGRSRSGKLREPHLGLLAYVADSYQRGITDDIVFVPVSIAYDQITDVSAYTSEQRGHEKEKESFLWSIKFITGLRSRHGNIYIRFGEPLRISEHVSRTLDLQSEVGRLALPKLAFDVSTRINDVTPITPISLVTMALLSHGDRGFTAAETIELLHPFVEFVEERGLPTSTSVAMATPEEARAALEQLVVNRVVTRTEGLTEDIYSITHDQHFAAAYYRNTIIHFFVTAAIAELALALAVDDLGEDAVVAHALGLRDLLKFEFFFAPTEEFSDDVRSELARHRVGHAASHGPIDVDVASMHPAKSPVVLRPFLEAYSVVAETLLLEGDQPVEAQQLKVRCLKMGEQLYHHGRIRNRESVSTALYDSGIKLVDNRGLLTGTTESRQAFQRELTDLLIALNSISDRDENGPPG